MTEYSMIAVNLNFVQATSSSAIKILIARLNVNIQQSYYIQIDILNLLNIPIYGVSVQRCRCSHIRDGHSTARDSVL